METSGPRDCAPGEYNLDPSVGMRTPYPERTPCTDTQNVTIHVQRNPHRVSWGRVMADGDCSIDPNDYADNTDRWVK